MFDGEGDVGGVVVADGLDDVVHDDVAAGDVGEDLGRDAWAVGDILDGDAGEVLLQGGARDDDVFHVGGLRDDPGPFVVVLAVAHVDGDVVLLGKLDGTGLEDRCAKAGQLQHLV